jgi:hypothetical protein
MHVAINEAVTGVFLNLKKTSGIQTEEKWCEFAWANDLGCI